MKKNILYIFACGILILAAAACSKEQASTEPQEETAGLITESFSAQKESEATKVTLDGTTFGWSNKDKAAFSIYDGADYDFVDSDFYGATVANKFTVSYTGTRQGYAVIPSTFAKTYDGTDLVVTYPTSYDISADVDGGCYDNADGAHFIPFPMIAVSTSGSSLTFRSIGALVKVTMNHIPAGTKNVYVTFNQTVTGDFTVANPADDSPSVSVSVPGASTPSTVSIKISEAGLTVEKNIVLYIPVPTTTGLEISSSTTAKATVARNNGYAWSVNAITRVDASTEFYWNGNDHMLASSNLWAHNSGGDLEYYFLSGTDQLCTTKGGFPNDPHVDGNPTTPSRANDGDYQDVYSWNDLYSIMMGEDAPAGEGSITKPLTIGGIDWYVYSSNVLLKFFSAGDRSRSNTVKNRSITGKLHAFIEIDVSGTPYAAYALYARGTGEFKTMISGRILFPDGFINQTDWVTSNALNDSQISCEISYDAFKKMVDAGALFLIQAGSFHNGEYHVDEDTGFSYHLRNTDSDNPADKSYYLKGSKGVYFNFTSGMRTTYRPVRLGRTIYSE